MYSCCSRVALYLVFIAVVKLLIKSITVFRDATWCQSGAKAYPATILQTSTSFTFNSPDEWPKSFEQYRVAYSLDKEDDERQVSTKKLTMC